MENNKGQYVCGVLRILMGWMMFWAFIDKLFGLGFATKSEASWLAGGSPTTGFLKAAVRGPFIDLFHSLSGVVAVDWLFMLGLGLIGFSLILGVGVKIAGYSGALMMIFMYMAISIWPANNPFLDEHIIYAVLFIGFALSNAGDYIGFGRWWGRKQVVQKFPLLK